jgi:hypothetical protein
MGIAVVALICLLGIAGCAKTIAVLGSRAPWTSSAWALTGLYFVAVLVKVTFAPRLPGTLEYAILAALTVVFVVAAVRDEPQAEPWWWPKHLGLTRAQRRAPLPPRSQKRSPKSNR